MSRIGLSFTALGFATLATLGACATGHEAMSGSIIMKVSDTEAHVCLFHQDTPIGSRVQLYRHTCAMQTDPVNHYVCGKQPVAVGTVSQKMAGHYALITFPKGTQYEEGYTVEQMP